MDRSRRPLRHGLLRPTALHLNNKDKHLGNPEVRWAINRYLDRQKLVDFAYDGKGQSQAGFFRPSKGCRPPLTIWLNSKLNMSRANMTLLMVTRA
ncbi:MAG: hypothetical protein R2911_07035 [Caldilineaceae bacterium]